MELNTGSVINIVTAHVLSILIIFSYADKLYAGISWLLSMVI